MLFRSEIPLSQVGSLERVGFVESSFESGRTSRNRPGSCAESENAANKATAIINILFITFLLFSVALFLKNLPQNPDRLHGADGVEVVPEIDQHGVEKLDPLAAVETDLRETAHVALQKIAQHAGALPVHIANVRGPGFRIKPLTDIEPVAGGVFVAGTKPQKPAQVGEKPQMEIGHALVRSEEHTSELQSR